MSEALISAKHLVKRFGSFTAVDGIDVEVHAGESFGFLGPNGSGKSNVVDAIAWVLGAQAPAILRLSGTGVPR